MTKALESRRGQGRIAAMQFLYEHELNASEDLNQAMEKQFGYLGIREGIAGYARKLVEGCVAHFEQIDRIISDHLKNWDLGRLGVIDRTILRIGVYEIMYINEVPPKVTLNEMIELSKVYGNSDSSGFVNGVLDAILKTLNQGDQDE